MKAINIQVGKCYLAKVSNKLTTVRVDRIIAAGGYAVTNLKTNRSMIFKSARRFQREVDDGQPKIIRLVPKEDEKGPDPTQSLSDMDGMNQLSTDIQSNSEERTVIVEPVKQQEQQDSPEGINQQRTEDTMSLSEREEGQNSSDPFPVESAEKIPIDAPATMPSSDPETQANPVIEEKPVVRCVLTGLGAKMAQHEASKNDKAPHIIVEARAGSGKTTTLIEGLKRVKGIHSNLVPSPQQAKVWESMELSKGKAQTICMVAFNKSIATELQKRVPPGCDAMTMHSLGFRAVQKQFGRQEPNSWVIGDIIAELLETDIRQLRRDKPVVVSATEELVSLCKMNLLEGTQEDLVQLSSYYDVELNGSKAEVFELVPKVLERCKEPKGKITFDDMIYLPVALDLPMPKYDLLLIDEAQDLSKCQQALAKKAGRRLVFVGDPKQSLYGFCGADSRSMERLYEELSETERGCIKLPLTVTRRCGKAIVKEANRYVKDFEAFETNPEGSITYQSFKALDNKDYRRDVRDGDFLLCRVNAPLVSECFRFLRQGRKANIQGRDIGAGLIKTVKKLIPNDSERMANGSTVKLIAALSDWLHAETSKEQAKRNPNEQRLIALQDKHDCICCFTEGQATVEGVIRKIESVFTDDKNGVGIRLSSVHKAKGLEANRVFILMPEGAGMPHPLAKSDWEREAELNILYVAITRAKTELVYVS